MFSNLLKTHYSQQNLTSSWRLWKKSKNFSPRTKLTSHSFLFFATDMKSFVKELMQKLIKPDVLSNAKSVAN